MTADDWQLALAFVGAISILFMLASIPALRLTLDRRVRKALPADKVYDSYLDLYGGLGRSIMLGLCCVFPHINNAPMYRMLYDNFDVKRYANGFERAISYSMVIGLLVFILCIITIFLTDVLNIFEW
ncbi:MAG: hypothetical protein ACI93R_003127 [Flavobacteriales bacterium]|jgi:hypothetical protein